MHAIEITSHLSVVIHILGRGEVEDGVLPREFGSSYDVLASREVTMQDQGGILTPPLSTLLISSVACGFCIHQFVKRVEVDRHPLTILGVVVAVPFLLAFGLQHLGGQYERYYAAYQTAMLVELCAVVSLWTNILLYRAFFHPLREFPGPFGAKLSKLWSLGKVVESNVRWYQVVGTLKNKYGDYVRTGMNVNCSNIEAETEQLHRPKRTHYLRF